MLCTCRSPLCESLIPEVYLSSAVLGPFPEILILCRKSSSLSFVFRLSLFFFFSVFLMVTLKTGHLLQLSVSSMGLFLSSSFSHYCNTWSFFFFFSFLTFLVTFN